MRQIIVHDLSQARAALAAAEDAGVRIELRSAPDAAAYAGLGYLKALGEAAGQELLIGCGDDAGLVMAGLRTGCRKLGFDGPAETGRRLREMADQVGARLELAPTPHDVLVLEPGAEAYASCSDWLARRGPP